MKDAIMQTHSPALKSGVSVLYDMEVNNYLVTRCMMKLNERISCLGKKRNIPKPKRQNSKLSYLDLMELLCLWGGIFGIVGGVIYGVSAADGFFGAIFGAFLYGFLFFVGGAVLGGLLTFAIVYPRKRSEAKKIEAEYQIDLQEYKKSLAQDEKRVQRELKEKKYLLHQRTILQTRLAEANENLSLFYDKLNIDRDYRNLIAIGYMHEFLSLGIATHLEGADGLYYLIRQEIRWDLLQMTLQDICVKLDSIIDKQSRIYDQLCAMNNKCDRILRCTTESVHRLAESQQLLERTAIQTEITAYNTERIAKEEQYRTLLLS